MSTYGFDADPVAWQILIRRELLTTSGPTVVVEAFGVARTVVVVTAATVVAGATEVVDVVGLDEIVNEIVLAVANA
jgi:hypothetical protein